MAEKKKKAPPPPPAKGAEKPSPSRVKLLILGLIVLLLLGGGGFAAYYFLWPKPAATGEAAGGTAGEPQAATQPPPQAAPPPAPVQLVYHSLGSFTVNIPSGQARFLRVGLIVATLSQAVPAALDKHMPRLRNDILTLLASQDFATLNTKEGKEALRESLRQALVRILASSGEPADIREVLFSDLIMQ